MFNAIIKQLDINCEGSKTLSLIFGSVQYYLPLVLIILHARPFFWKFAKYQSKIGTPERGKNIGNNMTEILKK